MRAGGSARLRSGAAAMFSSFSVHPRQMSGDEVARLAAPTAASGSCGIEIRRKADHGTLGPGWHGAEMHRGLIVGFHTSGGLLAAGDDVAGA